MGTFLKVAFAAVLFVGIFAGSLVVFQATQPLSGKELQERIDKDVVQVKKTLPQKVHPMVTWFDVESGPKTIIYKYQVHVPRSALMGKRDEMEQQLKGSFTSWAVSLMLPRGAKAQAALYDDNMRYAYTIDVVE